MSAKIKLTDADLNFRNGFFWRSKENTLRQESEGREKSPEENQGKGGRKTAE